MSGRRGAAAGRRQQLCGRRRRRHHHHHYQPLPLTPSPRVPLPPPLTPARLRRRRVRSFVRPVQKRSLSRSFTRGAVRCHGTRPWMPSRRASTAYVLGSFRCHRSCCRRYRHCHRCEISPPTSRPHRHSPLRVTHPIPLPPRTHQYVQPVPQKELTYEDFKEAYIDTVQTLERLATKEWAQTEVRSRRPTIDRRSHQSSVSLRNVDRRLM